MATENIIFKVLFDTTDATKQVASLDGVMENATKQVDEFTKNVKGGAEGLSNLAKAKKTFNDISIAESTNEIKELSSELSNATAKEKDFGKAGRETVDAYKKGKIDQVQATKQLGDAIDKGVVATQKMAVETEKLVGKQKSYKAQVMELKQILPTLSGQEYVDAQAKLAHLTDAMGDQQAQIK
jgi:predicted  nucleic acid-binding Zn-ribbon protein